ncbi:short-chain dehydrogenase reductase 3b-like [Pyrus ussuriensis x Pyrus communis]|uniref:Short-chain dehydrogenase reductase 3b-like n=1 Tax=Pyrus ussuriensis x Pyrus communis TaxID=2448454 RepID=A0A5N5G9X5_9ROSA|nr:short-chain dehydrogenase reductase 3b-like [Pyrus ussuriensis x Pyrus communis]
MLSSARQESRPRDHEWEMSLTLKLEGKVALIAGGIGEEAVRLFAANGASFVVADIQDDLGHQVVASIGSDRVSYCRCDFRDENQVENTVKFTLEKYGSLDILFSNAGVMGPMTGILDLDIQGFDNTMATNVRGVAATIKHAARAMVARSVRGSIICTTSVAASLGGTAPHSYTTSKTMAEHECCERGTIRNEVEANSSAIGNLKGIVLKARHVAEAALFLAADESAYVSGHNLVIDGGFTVVDHSFSAN